MLIDSQGLRGDVQTSSIPCGMTVQRDLPHVRRNSQVSSLLGTEGPRDGTRCLLLVKPPTVVITLPSSPIVGACDLNIKRYSMKPTFLLSLTPMLDFPLHADSHLSNDNNTDQKPEFILSCSPFIAPVSIH